jgi:hypothetical protein
MTDISARFAREVAQHEMTIAHDDGLYRHLKFRHTGKNYSGYYWFDLITVPGALFFQGDGDGFSFRRLEDMFEFFRSSAYLGRPNVQYWAEKLAGPTSRQVMTYKPEMLTAWVVERVRDAQSGDTLPGLADAVSERILEAEEMTWDDETSARRLIEDFRHYENEGDRYDPDKRPDFTFGELWEVSFRDYDWWFLWALEAILWGIGKYDEHHGRKSLWLPGAVETVELPDHPDEVPAGRPIITVDLPGGGS